MDSQNTITALVGNHLNHTVSVIGGHGTTAGGKRERAHLVLITAGFHRLFTLTHPRHFRMGINDRRNQIIVHSGFLPGNDLGHHNALFTALVSQHGTTHNVTDGIYTGNISRTAIIDKYKATFVQINAGVRRQQIFRIRPATNGHNQLVKGKLLFVALSVLIGNFNLITLDLRAGYPGPKTDIQPLFFEDFQGLFGNLLISQRQEGIERLKHDHLRPKPSPDTAQLQTDNARTNNTQTLRNLRKLQGPGGIDY